MQRHTAPCMSCVSCELSRMSHKTPNVIQKNVMQMSHMSHKSKCHTNQCHACKTLIVMQLSYKNPQNHSGGHSTRPHTILLYPAGLRDKISVNIALKNAEGHDAMHYMCTPITHHPAPSTQHPSPITHHPAPSTQHPAPTTHHPSPSTIPTTP